MADWGPWLGYALDWANLLLRWAHVVVAIAWVGSSFYFVWLDNNLTPPQDAALKDKGVGGELWAVHGGGFYNPQKYLGAPKQLPDHLHWFYWESYSTWLTGFALFTVLYLFNAGTFLIDRQVMAWSPVGAIGAALGFLAGFWLIYDLLCRTVGRMPGQERLLGGLVAAVVALAAWLACQWFAGRAAFLLVGAMIATAMSANVFFWIIPGQRKVVAAMRAGQPVDPQHGLRGKQRSVHNTYFVMPVLFAMLSNHYPFLTGASSNWLVLVALMLAGALIRHTFVARHKAKLAGQPTPWAWAASGVALLLAVGVWQAPPVRQLPSGEADPVSDAQTLEPQVHAIVNARCVVCHSTAAPNKGVALDKPELLAQHVQRIYQQAVVLKAMPMNNATRMTPAEREVIARWAAPQLQGAALP